MIDNKETIFAENIIDELNLSFYTFDEKNNQFIPKGNFGNSILKEAIDIVMKLSERNIAYEVTEDSLITLLNKNLNSEI